jgi:hypothetical protein
MVILKKKEKILYISIFSISMTRCSIETERIDCNYQNKFKFTNTSGLKLFIEICVLLKTKKFSSTKILCFTISYLCRRR